MNNTLIDDSKNKQDQINIVSSLVHQSLSKQISKLIYHDCQQQAHAERTKSQLLALLLKYGPVVSSILRSLVVDNRVDTLPVWKQNFLQPLLASSSTSSSTNQGPPASHSQQLNSPLAHSNMKADQQIGGDIHSTPGSLSFYLQRSGPAALSSLQGFRNALASIDRSSLDLADIARSIIVMARSSSDVPAGSSLWGPPTTAGDSLGRNSKWELQNFVAAVRELVPSLDWNNVIKAFDMPEFFCGDLRALDVLVRVHRLASQNGGPFPVALFFSRWKNPNGQISFLKWATQAPRDLLDLPAMSTNILTAESIASAPPSTRAIAQGWLLQQWNSLELLHTIIVLASEEGNDSALQLLDFASRQATELVLIGLCQIGQPWTDLHRDVVFRLITALLVGHSSTTFVLTRIWALNRAIIITAMVNYYRQEPNCLSRLLDVLQDLKGLNLVLEENVFPFVIDLAALASRREYLNLEKWLQDKMATSVRTEDFVKECLSFLRIKLMAMTQQTSGESPRMILLSEDGFNIFFKLILAQSANLSPAVQHLSRETHAMFTQMLAGAAGRQGGASESSFSPEVEETTNVYYEKIYTGELPVANVIDLLGKFRVSNDKKEKEIFSCMIHNLFDEFRFFQKYPDRELLVTGELFGSLIKNNFLTAPQLALGLRHVLDSLQRPLGSKMFRFGITALNCFQNRLPEWPQYCSHLLPISHLHDGHPELRAMLMQAISSPSVKTADSVEGGEDGFGVEKPSSTGPLTAESLSRTAEYSAPSSALQDQILFIMNNISESNLEAKLLDLKKLVTEPVYEWLSNYLVVKRVSIEPNYHGLYLSLVNVLNIQGFEKSVMNETYANIKILLASDKTLSSAQERSLLKNLGAWLGSLTLAKDKPIKHRDLALKQLLIEGYEKNRLIVNIPFVCKVLEQSKTSRAFKPPNPWLMAIIRLLLELYHFADLKLNLKFEIEVLCRNINIDLKDVEPTEILRMIKYEQEVMQFDNANGAAAAQQTQNQITPQIVVDEAGVITIVNLPSLLSFQSNPMLYNSHPALKKIVVVALEKAIREIIGPVVERSVSIALVTTRELVSKDFKNEGNEEKMRIAAQLMVQNLSGSLAQVTSREPLKNSFLNQLRILFQQSAIPVADNLLSMTVQENLNLGCAIIERMAMDKAIPEVNAELSQAYLARRRQRERGLRWVEPPSQSSNFKYPAMLPDVLNWHSGSAHQFRIYEDFQRQVNYGPGDVAALAGTPGPISPSDSQMPVNPLQQVTEKISGNLNELEKSIRENSKAIVADLPSNHEIILLVRQINLMISQFANRDEVALWFAQTLVDLLYKTDSAFGMEIYIILLERISELSRRVARECLVWLLFSDDERKLNVPVSAALIQSGMLNILELDAHLSKEMESVRLPVVEFGVQLMHKCLFEEPRIATPNEFHYSMLSLAKLAAGNHIPESVKSNVSTLRSAFPGVFISQSEATLSTKEAFVLLFDEWVRLFQANGAESTWQTFSGRMQEHHLLDDDNALASFMRYSTEVSVDTYYKLRNAPGGAILGYQVIDSLSSLVVSILKNVFKSDEQRLSKFSRFMSIFSLVTIHMHEVRRELFDQKPLFRLFSGIMTDIIADVATFGSIQFKMTVAMGKTFRVLKPSMLPGFIFAWLELVSHRLFMPRLLLEPGKVGWDLLHELLLDVFSFLAPFLRHADMSDPIRILYKGLLRVLLLLLHDFPEFLCDYHFSFCDLIPPSCIQLRNLILSAFPRNMRLPDPFTPNLKVDLLPEINNAPYLASDYQAALKQRGFTEEIDRYLATRSPESFLLDLKRMMMLSSEDVFVAGSNYDVPMINAVVLYVGTQAMEQMQVKSSGQAPSITQSAPMDVFLKLVHDFDAEGRYHFLNSIANQLRYPNSHTHYFSCVLLYLFVEANDEVIQEQITRVLLERLIVNRPHPWGLLITFIELLKNPRYNFWSHAFTRCATDIERLFESVARSCMIPTAAESVALA
eukprot:Partr_v1_DN28952_c0_g1_i2_m25897 putative ccr4-Not transcription complex